MQDSFAYRALQHYLSCTLSILMKKSFITFCFLLICCALSAQSFEGTIVYRNIFKSKVPSVTDQQFTDMLGSVQTYHIKGGDYRSDLNGTLMQWQLYVNADNKLYNKMANSEAALWNDAALNPDEVLSTDCTPALLKF